MDRLELLTRFRKLTDGKVDGWKRKGHRPDHFIAALTPVAERHGVLRQLQSTEGWRRCAEGSWHTSLVGADAVLLGVTVLEIEAVYRLTYGGKS